MNKHKVIDLPKYEDPRGNLSFIEDLNHIPFKIKRAYWIYDVPSGQVRGGHAFKEQQELIIALSGSFDVIIHDRCIEEKNIKQKYINLILYSQYYTCLMYL